MTTHYPLSTAHKQIIFSFLMNALCCEAGPSAPTLALDLYHWYTIRHSLALLLNKLINEENPDDVEELERQRIEECIYTQNLQARIAKIIDAEEKRLGITPIKE